MEILLENLWLQILIVASFVSVLLYFLLFTGILRQFSKKSITNLEAKLSVVMAVKNEADIIKHTVEKWMEQMPDAAELLIADDQSWDETPEILETLEAKFAKLKVVYLREDAVKLSGKKFAITLAVKGAKHSNILLSDADCYPNNDECMPLYAEKFSEGYTMVLGHSPIVGKAGFSGLLQKLEGLQNAIHYTGFSSLGMYYMGIGRALAYDKNKFLELGGFKALYKLPYGDDDLYVQKFAKHYKKTLLLNPKAFIYTDVIQGFTAYWNQKRRHLSAGVKYKFGHKFMLSLFPLAQTASLTALIMALCFYGLNGTVDHIAFIAFGIKTVAEILFYCVLGKKLAYGLLGLPLIVWQYISPLFNGLVYLSIKFKPVKIWMK